MHEIYYNNNFISLWNIQDKRFFFGRPVAGILTVDAFLLFLRGIKHELLVECPIIEKKKYHCQAA